MFARSYAFNKVIGVDLVELPSWNKASSEFWLNIVCWDTAYALFAKVGAHKSAEETWRQFNAVWLRHYGRSELVVSDGGG